MSDFLFLIDMYFKIDIMNLVIDVVLMLLTFLWLCQWILSYSEGINMAKHKIFVMGPKTYKNKMLNHTYDFQSNKISFIPSWDDKNELNLRKKFFNQNCVIFVSMLLSKLGRGFFRLIAAFLPPAFNYVLLFNSFRIRLLTAW